MYLLKNNILAIFVTKMLDHNTVSNVAAWWKLRSNETTRNHKCVPKGTFDTHIINCFF